MTLTWQLVVGFFLTLVALYSPLAAAYGRIIGGFDANDRRLIALRLFVYVSAFLVVVVAVGETAARARRCFDQRTRCRGRTRPVVCGSADDARHRADPSRGPDPHRRTACRRPRSSWQSVIAVTLAFPLSVGGSTVATTLAAVTRAETTSDLVVLAIVTTSFRLIVGLTALVGGTLPSRLSATGGDVLARFGGLLLTTIGLSVLVTNVTRIAVEVGVDISP